jgi:hypothetical protein
MKSHTIDKVSMLFKLENLANPLGSTWKCNIEYCKARGVCGEFGPYWWKW